MVKPIANFGYSVNDNTVAFSDLSLGQPVSWLWDFGDGFQSMDQNPTHTYIDQKTYIVTLTVVNADGTSEPYIENIIVNATTNLYISTTILELIGHYVPTAITSETSNIEKINLIRKWQMYLQPLITIPIEVEDSDTFNETKWPGLVKMLIAQLSAYDIILQAANAFMSISGRESESESDGGSGPGPDPNLKQQIKIIETGPAKTEWFENKTYLEESEIKKNLATAFAQSTKAGGALDQLIASICQLSARLRIYLPICGQLEHSPIVPQIMHTRRTVGGHNANPFGVTKRML